MSQAARLRDIVAILENSRHPVPRKRFLEELGVSLPTFKRDLDLLRDQMRAPIVWKRGDNGADRGYVLEDKGWASGKLGLPRAWFSASEIYALLMIDELAKHIGPGLLKEHLQPLTTRITMMLGAAQDSAQDVRSRIRILTSASKRTMPPHFEAVAAAVVRRKRLHMVYFTRSRNERSERTISPQLLIHYRENWYLLAWCHRADALRNFSVDAIEAANTVAEEAKRVAKKAIEELIGRNFGIFGGRDRKWAQLLFTPIQARWVSVETWHAEQRAAWQPDGSYLLEVPYSDPRELMLEILKYADDVEVLGPPELRAEAAKRLKAAAARYSTRKGARRQRSSRRVLQVSARSG
jgi:predicted DNA-binding transcriptional regulator YafY